MLHQGLQYLIEKINKEVITLQESLADDTCRDFSDYKKVCGEVKGLLTARMYCLDLQKRAEENDE